MTPDLTFGDKVQKEVKNVEFAIMTNTMKPETLPYRLVFAFFLSGAAVLIYEIVWSRFLQIIFSTTTYTASTIFAIFLLGFSIGSFFFRNIKEEDGKILKLVSKIDFFIAFYGVLMLVIIPLLSKFYVFLPGSLFVRLIISAIFLLPPAILMGAQWPLINSLYIKDKNILQKTSGKLYFMNSLGSAFGAFICGFFLVPLLGFKIASLFAVLFCIIAGWILWSGLQYEK
jgi:spermidine synthase